MTDIFLTADHHDLHGNIITYCSRPFKYVEEMRQSFIISWNKTVSEEDIVYHLGDVTLANIESFAGIMSHLNGTIYIIPGNHDWKWVNQFHYMPTYSKSGKKVLLMEPLVVEHTISKKAPPTLCHYPMREWYGSHHGCLHFHGHSHGNLPYYKNSLDVGVDNAYKLLGSYRPFLYSEATYYATKAKNNV